MLVLIHKKFVAMSVGKTMILSEVDHKILESYKTVLEGLADYLGDGCEIALIVWRITTSPSLKL